MCGRYRLSITERELADAFGADPEDEWTPRYNLAPTDNVPIVRQNPADTRRKLNLAKWGLIPSWSNGSVSAAKMINARAETVADKPSFRDAFLSRRCLVPANGFYEWRKQGTGKQPFHIGFSGARVFGMAGIWDNWKSETGEWVRSCSIITVAATGLMAQIHDRMPLVIKPDGYDLWLDPSFNKLDDLKEFLRPKADRDVECYPVSDHVNSVRNDDAICAEKWTAPAQVQPSLWALED
jgi:putative SOS response-associated peptidase YedK